MIRVSQNLLLRDVDLVALTYSMGDGLTSIVRLEDAPHRGLVSLDGAGLHQGGGTRVFEAVSDLAGRRSSCPAYIAPAISIPG